MSEVPFNRAVTAQRPGLLETLIYRTLVVMLIAVSAFAIITARVFGAKRQGSLWQEAKEAAYAVAGYAFKH